MNTATPQEWKANRLTRAVQSVLASRYSDLRRAPYGAETYIEVYHHILIRVRHDERICKVLRLRSLWGTAA